MDSLVEGNAWSSRSWHDDGCGSWEPLSRFGSRRRIVKDVEERLRCPVWDRLRNGHGCLNSAKRLRDMFSSRFIMLLAFLGWIMSAQAALITGENCLDPGIKFSDPKQLQFEPTNFSAVFDSKDMAHTLNITIYGNVTGSSTTEQLPPPDDPSWRNRTDDRGKIPDISMPNNQYSTLFARFDVLTYTPFEAPASRFCGSLVHGQCPLGPVFNSSRVDLMQLPAFSLSHDFYSSYAFATISGTFHVTAGDAAKTYLACVSANITPDLGRKISDLLSYLPLAVLIFVGLVNISAAIFSPWGSSDTFKWTTNYGRDEDLLRLVTPGFGDCLQYIQFVILTGSLSLNYPGYFQPVVSRVGWSTLMFNTSFVSHGNGTQNPVDGIYVANGTYGLDRTSQLIGMSTPKDIWAGMIIWLLAIIIAGVAFMQAGFFSRWGYRHISHIQEEDLRAKNLPFTIGNVVRVIYNYFLLPVVALSLFQLVVAGYAPAAPATTALAAIFLIVVVGFGLWALRVIFTTRPRVYLFDDLPSVLLYGPLYNTYSDDAALFAAIPLLLQFLRGVAIGALQPSGIAQLALLAVCEILLILAIFALRPHPSATSMNMYQIFFAIVRLLTIFLSIAFAPALGVTEAPKGWIGYIILLMHAIVLVFGFLLNAIQTVIEVAARLAGAGGEEGVGGGVARGGLVKVFGMRQLSRRLPRGDRTSRQSRMSDAAFFADNDDKSQLRGGRARSTSGSSAVLLNRHGTSDGRTSMGLESLSGMQGSSSHARPGSGSTPYTPTTLAGTDSFPQIPAGVDPAAASGGIIGLRTAEAADPYYRPPRARRMTTETFSPGRPSRQSWHSAEWANKRWSQTYSTREEGLEQPEGPSISGRVTPKPSVARSREFSDPNVDDMQAGTPDYAVREVDFYYNVRRGPALSNAPARRLGTGPADPTGPVASAAGWFKGLFGGKTKDTAKGFEVVRSTPAGMPIAPRSAPVISQDSSDLEQDDRTSSRATEQPTIQATEDTSTSTETEDIGVAIGPESAEPYRDVAEEEEEEEEDDDISSPDEADDSEIDDGRPVSGLPELPPSLPGIDLGGGIELPSRYGSKTSSRPSRDPSRRKTPQVPRKSSKRKSGTFSDLPADFLSPGSGGVVEEEALYDPPLPSATLGQPHHLQPINSRMPFESEPSSASGHRASTEGGNSRASSMLPSANFVAPMTASYEDYGAAPPSQSQEQAEDGEHDPTRHSSSLFGTLTSPPAIQTQNDRPTSMGYVQQHRASDNIHEVANVIDPHGSAAELVENAPRSSASTERRPGDAY